MPVFHNGAQGPMVSSCMSKWLRWSWEERSLGFASSKPPHWGCTGHLWRRRVSFQEAPSTWQNPVVHGPVDLEFWSGNAMYHVSQGWSHRRIAPKSCCLCGTHAIKGWKRLQVLLSPFLTCWESLGILFVWCQPRWAKSLECLPGLLLIGGLVVWYPPQLASVMRTMWNRSEEQGFCLQNHFAHHQSLVLLQRALQRDWLHMPLLKPVWALCKLHVWWVESAGYLMSMGLTSLMLGSLRAPCARIGLQMGYLS